MHRRRLGGELRRLRELAGRTHRDVATHLDCSQGKISQIELGRVPVRTSDVRLMAELYGAKSDQATKLIELARNSKQPGWWQEYPSTARCPGLETYLGLETTAAAVRCFSAAPVPELLRTEHYNRAVLRSCGFAHDEIEERVAVTAARQQRLVGENPLELWAVLDESALRRVVDGPAVMRAQLEHLVLAGYRRNITVQVLPFHAGAHSLMSDRVTVFSFSETADPRVVHVGDSTNSRFLDKPAHTRTHLSAFEEVRRLALPAKESHALISTIADEHNPAKSA